VQVGVRVARQIVVDGQVDALDVDASAEDVGGDADTLVEFFEFFVAFDAVGVRFVMLVCRGTVGLPLFLTDAGMDGDAGEVALAEKLVEFRGSEGALDEDDDLVEFQGVEQLVQLSILLRLAKLDVELLETVKGELRLIVNVDFKRVLHELLANRADLLCECGTEHHNLLLGGCCTEDVLNITTHI